MGATPQPQPKTLKRNKIQINPFNTRTRTKALKKQKKGRKRQKKAETRLKDQKKRPKIGQNQNQDWNQAARDEKMGKYRKKK